MEKSRGYEGVEGLKNELEKHKRAHGDSTAGTFMKSLLRGLSDQGLERVHVVDREF